MHTPPTHIGGLRVIRALGEGSISRVYLAVGADEVRVAVKVFEPNAVKLVEGARLLGEHPNLLAPRHVHVDNQRTSVVMDTLEATPASFEGLAACTFEEIVDLYAKAADVLVALASKGLSHGNVKPSNLLCRHTKKAGPSLLVADAGLRYLWDPARIKGDVAGRILPFMAPEALEAFTATPRAEQPGSGPGDVYALAASLCQALTGTTPFAGAADPAALVAATRRRRYRVALTNDPSTPLDARALDAVVTGALAPDPASRPSLASLPALLRATIDREKLAALSA